MARHGSGMSQLWDPVPQSPHLGHRRATGIEQLSPCKVLMRQVSKKLGKWNEETETVEQMARKAEQEQPANRAQGPLLPNRRCQRADGLSHHSQGGK